MRIRFTRHATFKIALINEHGFPLTAGQVIDAIRVIYEADRGIFTVVTVMIIRRMRYERQHQI